MSEQTKTQFRRDLGAALGALLISLGVLFLAGQLFHVELGHWGWPFFIIVPGSVVLALGIAVNDQTSRPLILVGSVTTATGMLLFYQNATDHYASWAYAWALIAPTAFGAGELIYGLLKDHPQAVTAGTRLITIGLIIFFVGAIFFELVIGIGGFGLNGWVWPVVLICLGAFLVLSNLISGNQKT
jgi:hypothetical protein